MRSGDFALAERITKARIAEHPTHPRLLAYAGFFHFRRGEYAPARDFFLKATMCDIRFLEAGIYLIRCLDYLGEYDEALRAAEYWFTIEPANKEVIHLLKSLKRTVQKIDGQWEKSKDLKFVEVEMTGDE